MQQTLKYTTVAMCLLLVVSYCKAQSASQSSVTVGTEAPAFTQLDIDGNEVSLSDFKGKYIILEFWGSWCVHCRKSHPHLVELYEKYKGKNFDIISLAANDKREAWLKAIKEDKLLWSQINLAENKAKQDVAKLYGIKAYPTKILIDPKGVIVAYCTNNMDDIDNKLKQVFKK